jgi:hypothetical protein
MTPLEDRVISMFAGLLANHDRAHSRGHKLLECESDHSQFRSLPSFASSSIEVGDPDNDNSGSNLLGQDRLKSFPLYK